ncbi:MAG: antitoxin [Ilumatobacteraceae bacterium]
MGLFDKVKGLTKGREQQIKQGIDKVADMAQKKAPDKHDGKIDQAATKAKGFVDKLDGKN